MKLQFRKQRFQEDAAKSVCDVFLGQPKKTVQYMIDRGRGEYQLKTDEEEYFTGWGNNPLIPSLTADVILKNLNKVQRNNNLEPSKKLEGHFNLTIEMETGVGKTYTYIKTIFELNEKYDWSKFIIVVPSVAIREGVYKSFQVMEEHFAMKYKKKAHCFIYNSANLTEIDKFSNSNSISVMIINAQAFNATGKDARRIKMKLDDFRSRRPIDVIAKNNPLLIIDEPQSVEGAKTKEGLKDFNPLMTLRYSATHKDDSIYNMVYRLDAIDAYRDKLVKKIEVTGISETGSTATESFLYLESIYLSKSDPTATLSFDYKGTTGVRKISRKVSRGYNLYDHSNNMEEYKNNFIVTEIDGRNSSVTFMNGIKIYAGDVIGQVNEEHIRRIQIRETIISHIEKERQLYKRGIKVLSLFFIDEVAKYKQYGESNQAFNGRYADIFEEEYNDIIGTMQREIDDEKYLEYLSKIETNNTHTGYFSIDKNKRFVDGGKSKKEQEESSDVEAYDLIMKNKELLLDLNPMKSPVRFLFSHSALREGWDNPNVFQICTLKQSGSTVRKRQEVGRGLRLCVNQEGVRMDSEALDGEDAHDINVLTVIANESYDSFAKGLQSEFAEAVANRPRKVDISLFENRKVKDINGENVFISKSVAEDIHYTLIVNGYIDKHGVLTDKFYEDKANDTIKLSEEVNDIYSGVIDIIGSIYNENMFKPENSKDKNVILQLNDEKLAMKEFKELWDRINRKSYFIVDFEPDELIEKAIQKLNADLKVSEIYLKVETGVMKEIKSKETLEKGEAFTKIKNDSPDEKTLMRTNSSVRYDLIGKLVEDTGLTRKDVVKILTGIEKVVFNQFKNNPEEFIIKAGNLINEQKATAIVEHIAYDILEEKYDIDVFEKSKMSGKLDVNVFKSKNHLFDHVLYDSTTERAFAEELDVATEVAVYVKLPNSFFINTPLGKYNPDWAIAFYEGAVKHIYFVAETKGSMSTMQLKLMEKSKIHCATEHFKAISNDEV
ncbi:MAG: type III restriction-modification system endonuclease, partial [Aminipila sp.]